MDTYESRSEASRRRNRSVGVGSGCHAGGTSPDQQQQLEWLDGGTLALLLDGKATDGQSMMGRFDVSRGEAPPFHKHLNEDEV